MIGYIQVEQASHYLGGPPMFKTPVLVVALVSSSVVAAPPDADKSAGEGRILIWKEGKHVLLNPAGKALEELPENRKQFRLLKPDGKTVEIPFPEKSRLTDPSISPDGKRVAFIVFEAPPGIEVPIGRDREFNFLHNVFVCKPDGAGEGHALGINGQNLAWTPEGKLLVVEAASEKDVRSRKFTTWLVDVVTKEKTKLDVPATAQIFCA